MGDKLGPTGNTYSACVWCGTAHHPIAACGHEGLRETIAILRAENKRLRAYLQQQIAASNNILNSEVDCDFRYEQGCIAALRRVQQFLDSEEE